MSNLFELELLGYDLETDNAAQYLRFICDVLLTVNPYIIELKEEMIDWLDSNTPGWRIANVIKMYTSASSWYGLIFFFETEAHLVYFKMRWM